MQSAAFAPAAAAPADAYSDDDAPPSDDDEDDSNPVRWRRRLRMKAVDVNIS
jgi:hypothetical protein